MASSWYFKFIISPSVISFGNEIPLLSRSLKYSSKTLIKSLWGFSKWLIQVRFVTLVLNSSKLSALAISIALSHWFRKYLWWSINLSFSLNNSLPSMFDPKPDLVQFEEPNKTLPNKVPPWFLSLWNLNTYLLEWSFFFGLHLISIDPFLNFSTKRLNCCWPRLWSTRSVLLMLSATFSK